jgi:hypothetical protein
MDLELESPLDELEAVEYEADDGLLGDATVVTCVPAKCTSGVN